MKPFKYNNTWRRNEMQCLWEFSLPSYCFFCYLYLVVFQIWAFTLLKRAVLRRINLCVESGQCVSVLQEIVLTQQGNVWEGCSSRSSTMHVAVPWKVTDTHSPWKLLRCSEHQQKDEEMGRSNPLYILDCEGK